MSEQKSIDKKQTKPSAEQIREDIKKIEAICENLKKLSQRDAVAELPNGLRNAVSAYYIGMDFIEKLKASLRTENQWSCREKTKQMIAGLPPAGYDWNKRPCPSTATSSSSAAMTAPKLSRR